MGGDQPPSRRWKIQRPSRARVKQEYKGERRSRGDVGVGWPGPSQSHVICWSGNVHNTTLAAPGVPRPK